MKHGKKFFLITTIYLKYVQSFFLHIFIIMNIFKQPFLTTYSIKYDKIYNRVYSLNLCRIVENTVYNLNCN